MNINRQEYLKKVRGCFIGKNIGGTLGGPYEGTKDILDVKGFVTKKGEPLPNDDLDLQLVWLNCLEEQGPRYTDSDSLGDYWNSFIVMKCNEYGICQSNMANGFKPSIAGEMPNNIWKHSNGAWIRTEVWASVCPGAIDNAVRYAIEDASIDHGFGEGTHAACFVAALESAAFFVNDVEKLIDIGLSKTYKDSRLHKTIALVREEYYKGTPWKETRNKVVKLNKDFVGGWFQAPNNIAFVVIGLLYGKGDFKKSMLTAINCGDDTDCTAATVGSILGIMYGIDKIPSDWSEYIGNDIKSVAINQCFHFTGPKTIDDLVNRINFQADHVLLNNHTNITISDEPTSISQKELDAFMNEFGLLDERDEIRITKYSFKPNTFKQRNGTMVSIVTYKDGMTFKAGEEREIEVVTTNNIKSYGNCPRNVRYELILPSGVSAIDNSKNVFLPSWSILTLFTVSDPITFKIKFDCETNPTETIILKATVIETGREYFIPIKFLRA